MVGRDCNDCVYYYTAEMSAIPEEYTENETNMSQDQ